MQVDRVREAFDRHAANYDERFSSRARPRELRETVWRVAERYVAPGGHILDLGCGTGEDAVHFAQTGRRVTAIDVSPAMIEQARSKTAGLGLDNRVTTQVADIGAFVPDAQCFDAVFSNFGAVNCLASLEPVRTIAARALRPDGCLLIVLMGQFYPLETIIRLTRGDVRGAFQRLRPTTAMVEGVPIRCTYYSMRGLRRALGADFERLYVQGLCGVSPSPALEHLQGRIGMRFVDAMDAWFTMFPLTASFADHFLSLWRFRPGAR